VEGRTCGVEFLPMRTQDAAAKVETPCAWVFVDACHCYVCVAADIELWAPKIVSGGHMAFHDVNLVQNVDRTCHVGNDKAYAVSSAIEESQFMRRNFKLVRKSETGYGMGVYERL
jgi:hypothetical protein